MVVLPRGRWSVAPLLAGVVLLAPAARAKERAANPCSARPTSIVVDVAKGRLWLCQERRVHKDYAVAVGRGGGGKSVEGNRKTPLGRYSLGEPRPSKDFGLFIPIGYPTEEQRKRGVTGGDVGVHGPKRSFKWAGRMNTWFNWTRGCIAVATDAAIREIAEWVRAERPASIQIE